MTKAPFALALLAATLMSLNAVRAETAGPLTVSLTDYAFTPSMLALKAGLTYHLHLVNAGTKDHDFSAPEFFAASQVAPDDAAKVRKGTVAIDRGQALDIAVTPLKAGAYTLTCTHFMHSMLGMKGTITVQ